MMIVGKSATRYETQRQAQKGGGQWTLTTKMHTYARSAWRVKSEEKEKNYEGANVRRNEEKERGGGTQHHWRHKDNVGLEIVAVGSKRGVPSNAVGSRTWWGGEAGVVGIDTKAVCFIQSFIEACTWTRVLRNLACPSRVRRVSPFAHGRTLRTTVLVRSLAVPAPSSVVYPLLFRSCSSLLLLLLLLSVLATSFVCAVSSSEAWNSRNTPSVSPEQKKKKRPWPVTRNCPVFPQTPRIKKI